MNGRAGRPDRRMKSADRRRNKQWLIDTFGDGDFVPCVHCKCKLDFVSLEQDRIIPGGSYARKNIQPSCRPCNIARSNNPKWIHPGETAQWIYKNGKYIKVAQEKCLTG